MYYLLIFSCLLSIFSLSHCKSGKSSTSMPEGYIKIGSGGGFVGKETLYTVFENGEIELNGQKLKKLKNPDITQIIKNYKLLGLDEYNLNEPGNIYRVLEYNINGEAQKIVWGDFDNPKYQSLNLFYNNFDYLIQKAIK
jgi:hypothetical protein